MLCVPPDKDEVLKVATPDPFSVPVPSVVVTSLNVTVPVGVPEAPPLAVTVALKVTDWPSVDGLLFEVSDVEVPA